MPITKRDVDAVGPGSIIWDRGRGSVSGFGLRRQKLARVFVLKYAHGGRGRWYTIGKYGAPWTVETARVEAKRLLGEIARGADPAAERRTAAVKAKPVTIDELCDAILKRPGGG